MRPTKALIFEPALVQDRKGIAARAALLIVAATAAAALASTAGAITNGTPDENAHPYVGTAVSGDVFCSGTLLSPTVFLTAGHCTDAFAHTGEPTYVTTDPNASPTSPYVAGRPFTQPGFFNAPPQGVGVPGSVGNDLGVVVLNSPIAAPRYAHLPAPGALATNPKLSVTLVGYGAQGWVPGAGGRRPFFTFVRTQADAQLVNDANANGSQFVLVSTSPGGGNGGIGPGDSGAPALVDDTVVAAGSHGPSPSASGAGYFTRLDTPEARAFVQGFLERQP